MGQAGPRKRPIVVDVLVKKRPALLVMQETTDESFIPGPGSRGEKLSFGGLEGSTREHRKRSEVRSWPEPFIGRCLLKWSQVSIPVCQMHLCPILHMRSDTKYQSARISAPPYSVLTQGSKKATFSHCQWECKGNRFSWKTIRQKAARVLKTYRSLTGDFSEGVLALVLFMTVKKIGNNLNMQQKGVCYLDHCRFL